MVTIYSIPFKLYIINYQHISAIIRYADNNDATESLLSQS